MSGKSAALALLNCDCELKEFAEYAKSLNHSIKRETVIEYVRNNVIGTWTLTLAAMSAKATEEQVISQLLYEIGGVGSIYVCQCQSIVLMKG